ncbi:MAG: hypothetical protein JRI68_05175 [Deltaproteobacteria bacterium]|nr:hypothetical protein [Deltaproteobacteria bacterium]
MTAQRITQATAAVGGLLLAIIGACFVEGFDVNEGAGGTTTSTGTTGGGGTAGSGGTQTCSHATWPGPPATADPGPDDVEFVVAARSIDFGEVDLSVGPAVGFDLDGRCTCQGEGDSCNEPDWASADHCDGPGGRDNAIAQLFHDLGAVDADFTSAHYTETAEQGEDSLLLRVRDYNGQPNDDQVTVSLHPSEGTDDDPCNPPGTQPDWDGSDLWSINAASLNGTSSGAGAGGSGPGGAGSGGGGGTGGQTVSCGHNGYDIDDARYVDENAYVTDGTLVASLPEVALEFTSGDDNLPVVLKAGFLAARLEQEGSSWSLRDGLVVGRWTLAEFFKMIGSITAQHEPICTDTSVYSLLKHALCQYPDIASELVGPTEPCDALSFAMRVEAYPAQIGSVLPAFQSARLCPAETDPMFDSCEPTPD